MAEEKDKLDPNSGWLVARHKVSLWGQVTDAITKKPIEGAEVTLTVMPPDLEKSLKRRASYEGDEWTKRTQRPDKTRSRADGIFYFLDLPDGDYEVCAALPNCGKRYGESRQKRNVSGGDKNGSGLVRLKAMWLALTLQPTAIKGRVTDAAKKTGVMMAEVRLKGSGERAFSDARGEFVLGPVEASSKAERTLECLAQGYARKEKARILVAKPGQLLELGDVDMDLVSRK